MSLIETVNKAEFERIADAYLRQDNLKALLVSRATSTFGLHQVDFVFLPTITQTDQGLYIVSGEKIFHNWGVDADMIYYALEARYEEEAIVVPLQVVRFPPELKPDRIVRTLYS